MSNTNKEQVYDTMIAPLMTQIIGICREHGIAMIASYAIPTEEDDGLRCTTCLPDEHGKNADGHKEALRALKFTAPAFDLRTEHSDGSVTLARILP